MAKSLDLWKPDPSVCQRDETAPAWLSLEGCPEEVMGVERPEVYWGQQEECHGVICGVPLGRPTSSQEGCRGRRIVGNSQNPGPLGPLGNPPQQSMNNLSGATGLGPYIQELSQSPQWPDDRGAPRLSVP